MSTNHRKKTRPVSGFERAVMRTVGGVHAVLGFIFLVVAATAIIPNAGLIGLPFLLAGGLFFLNGLRMLLSKKAIPTEIEYDGSDEWEMEEPKAEPETHDHISSIGPSAQSRLKQLESLKRAGLISDKEFKEKRQQLLREL